MGSKLYVWIRSDLASMTPGKAAAQVAHAASQAARSLFKDSAYIAWEEEPSLEVIQKGAPSYPVSSYKSFGTTIVLDGGNGDDLESLYFTQLQIPFPNGRSGLVVDPSYPLRDGQKMFFLQIPTCAWAFCEADMDTRTQSLISKYPLYNGNKG